MTREVFTLPDLGEGLEEAELVRWLVAVGDTVAVDAPVAEVETAKAMVEVPSPYGGVVACLHGEEGDVIAVGSPLLSVDAGDGPPSQEPPTASSHPRPVPAPRGGTGAEHAAAATYREEERAGSGNVLIGYGTSEAPVAGGGRRAARRAGTTVATTPTDVHGAGGGGGAPAGADDAPVPGADRAPATVPVISPLVRMMARAAGVDLRTVRGTGPGGLVVRRDVEQAIGGLGAPGVTDATDGQGADGAVRAAEDHGADQRTGLPVRERVPLTGVRRAIATALSRSRQEIPEATTWVDVDATALLELRASLASPDRPAPGILALVARFVVAGLERFPALNARVDTDGGQIVHLDGVNLGIAAQTDRGLVVPVVRGAHTLRTRALDEEIRRLTTAAREGRATTADLTGGSFTLNNYGVLGVDGSAAIINHPEVAILGMGRILPRPWVVDGEVVVRSITQLSLVFDHRVCDGGTAGGFLRFVADAVERPVPTLVDLA